MIKISVRMRIKPPKRRTPKDKLKARLYYRKNRSKIRLQRKKYLRKYKSILKDRKLFRRYKPTWFKKRVPSKPAKPKHTKKPKIKVFKPSVPKRV